MCKVALNKVAVLGNSTQRFETLDFRSLAYVKQWDTCAHPRAAAVPAGLSTQRILHSFYCSYFDDTGFLEYMRGWSNKFSCPECCAEFPSLSKLRKHRSNVHSHAYCELCLTNRRVFLPEQVVCVRHASALRRPHEHSRHAEPFQRPQRHMDAQVSRD